MSAPLIPSKALWLDPFRALKAAEQAQLGQAGVLALAVSTLDDLQASLEETGDSTENALAMVVLGLGNDVGLLEDTLALVSALANPVAVVCRVERRQLELAIAAFQKGAVHVLAADDFSPSAWHTAMQSVEKASIAAARASHSDTKTEATPKKSPISSEQAVRSVVYVDPVSRNLLALAQRVAQANVAVLIEGPTGSGKEVLARVIHESSNAAHGPFIGLNCAAMPEHMIEDMLFGHEKGAFTGAVKDHRGLFEQAQGGTLFLDEIGELPLQLQAKLLRVLQERTLVRLGGERSIQLDVRVVAATNKNLREAIGQREFREDLYFRLSTFKLRVPPLCERVGDILPLLARLLARHTQGTQVWRVSPAAQGLLMAYGWPGNVRELENVVQRAMVLCADHHIDTEHLMFDDMPDTALLSVAFDTESVQAPLEVSAPEVNPQGLQAAVKHSEQHLIRSAIETSNSRIEAAQKLGISPRTLRYKLAQLRESSPAQLVNA
jgi:two-component system response regulator FlrC